MAHRLLRPSFPASVSSFVRQLRGLVTAGSNSTPRILVTGSSGQIGQELVPYLKQRYGSDNVIASDIKAPDNYVPGSGSFSYADVLDFDGLARIITERKVTWVVHLSSLLSATGENNPQLALKINAGGIQNILELARMYHLRVFAPSTIAVFGPSTPRDSTPDLTIMRPTTMYGLTKIHLELLGEYYHKKFGVDFRSIRYPGVISAEALPGGGTTDYAVEIYYEALRKQQYTSFLSAKTALPMMFMADCLKATVGLLAAPSEQLKQRVYNVTAMSFTPEEVAASITKHIPSFRVAYKPDFRQAIADTWPASIDDSCARNDWGWKHDYDLEKMTEHMLRRLKEKL